MEQNEHLSLDNLGKGAATELFNAELEAVLKNILDPNTKPTTTREVTLKVKIKPDDDREVGQVEIHCTSKQAPSIPYPTQVLFGKHKGKPFAQEYNPKQKRLFDQQAEPDNVIPMDKKGGVE